MIVSVNDISSYTPPPSLRLIAPVVKDHGVDYERGKFQDKLNDGSLTLARTKVQYGCIIDIIMICL